jgi:hypothetical protein
LLASLGRVARLLGLGSEARSYLESAVEEYRRRGDALGEGESMVRLSAVEWQQGETGRSRELDLHAIKLLETQPSGQSLAYA